MSSACRPGLLLALLAFAATASAKAPPTPPVAPFDCSGEVCGFNVTAASLIGAPCEGRAVLVAYSRSSGMTLVQCSSPGHGDENLLYAFDRRAPAGRAYEFEGGRYVEPGSLAQAANDGIPDRFGSVPLCTPPATAQAGELTWVVKEPGGSGDRPYCYRLYHAVVASATVAVRVDGADAPAPSRDGRARWSRLVAKLLPYVDPAAAAPAGGVVVGVAQARLYSRPDEQSLTRMYLVQGDAVRVLESAPCGSWTRIRYVTKGGRTLDRWVRSADLAK